MSASSNFDAEGQKKSSEMTFPALVVHVSGSEYAD